MAFEDRLDARRKWESPAVWRASHRARPSRKSLTGGSASRGYPGEVRQFPHSETGIEQSPDDQFLFMGLAGIR